ncbi:MAG TPA: Ppx/GppA family phosphatase [Polyangia bacterium]|nr:Ppx/GppA family phosphatase [Polyangia bacterium]
MVLATIDVGTNTTLLLIARVREDGRLEAVDQRAEITRLGRGIGAGGALGAEGIGATLAALRGYADLARAHGARIAAVGTEALRRAPNGPDFLLPAAETLGVPIEVIDGEREAELTFRAVIESFPDARQGHLIVVDIGGGSTEIVLADGGRHTLARSLPLGSVRLTEQNVHNDPIAPGELQAVRAAVASGLAGIDFPPGAALVGVAGTVTSLAAMAESMATYDPERVHGYRLSRAQLAAQIARLAVSRQPDRERMIGLDPRRADVILAGAVILEGIAAAAGATEVRVSDRGIRWGLARELAEKLGRSA